MNLLTILTVSAVSIWLGALAFFSIFVVPAAFSILGRESAGRLAAAIFPRYYLFGLVLGLVALVGGVGRLWGSQRGPVLWAILAILLLMLVVTLYTLMLLLPAVDSARLAMRAAGADPTSSALPEAQAFARLHRLSVILNGLTLLAGLALVALEAAGAKRAG